VIAAFEPTANLRHRQSLSVFHRTKLHSIVIVKGTLTVVFLMASVTANPRRPDFLRGLINGQAHGDPLRVELAPQSNIAEQNQRSVSMKKALKMVLESDPPEIP
jgi:hypothetical protein